MPMYNVRQHLTKALDSVLAQTYENFQMYIVDNDSTDGSSDIARDYASKDSRIVYWPNPQNIGGGNSTARLVYLADTEYFVIIHADLMWAPTYLEECLKVLDSDPDAVLAYSQCQFLDMDGNDLELYRDVHSYSQEDPAERFLSVVTNMGWCTTWHGVVRTLPFLLCYNGVQNSYKTQAATDNLISAVLTFSGKLVQIEKKLFFRHKGKYQLEPESMEERYERLYGKWWNTASMPFCYWFRTHCLIAGFNTHLSPKKRDDLVRQVLGVLTSRYAAYLDFEIERQVDLVISGKYNSACVQEGWDSPDQFRFINMMALTENMEQLEWAYMLRPKSPKLSLALAMIYIQLGRQEEALARINNELRINPTCIQSLELKPRLEKLISQKNTDQP